MRLWKAIAGTVAVGAAALAGGHPDSSGWKALFAADLSNAESKAGVWSVTDGEMTATEDQCLWTKESFENFTLDLEFKTGDAANSGVVIYCSDAKNWIPNSVEVQILDDFSPKWKDVPATWRCGGIFGHLAPSKSAVRKPGEWNRMTITAKGPTIVTVLNGETVSEMDMRKWTSARANPDGSEIPPWLSRPFAELATKGRIGLQGKHGGATIAFRNVRIQSLPQ